MMHYTVIGIQPFLNDNGGVIGLRFRYRVACERCHRSAHFAAYTEDFQEEYQEKALDLFDEEYLESLSTLLYHEQVLEPAQAEMERRYNKMLLKETKPDPIVEEEEITEE